MVDVVPGRRIGHVTDLSDAVPNIAALEALLGGVDLLCIEAVFADADRGHAQHKRRRCSRARAEPPIAERP